MKEAKLKEENEMLKNEAKLKQENEMLKNELNNFKNDMMEMHKN